MSERIQTVRLPIIIGYGLLCAIKKHSGARDTLTINIHHATLDGEASYAERLAHHDVICVVVIRTRLHIGNRLKPPLTIGNRDIDARRQEIIIGIGRAVKGDECVFAAGNALDDELARGIRARTADGLKVLLRWSIFTRMG